MILYNNQQSDQLLNLAQVNLFTKISAFALLIPFLFVACENDSATSSEPERELVWEDKLNDNANNWITDETSGPEGWCGDITHHNDNNGPVSASSGSGYAVAEHGACNNYWQEQDVPSSGPYAFFGELASQWPSNGFTQELDIYLDPSWSAGPSGSVFIYVNSFRLLDGEYPNNLRYLFIPVTKQDGNLQVMGNNISEKGWYTFRFIFSNKDENLGVTFELIDGDQKILSSEIDQTSQSEEQISSFEATNTGNGYGWFLAINPDLGLPVDEQQMFHQES